MKFVAISDTHNQHNHKGLILPDADCILHAGDISGRGWKSEVEPFLEWFSNLPYKYKVFIAGNHDFLFEDHPNDAKIMLDKYSNIIYLNDSGVEIEGVKIWGSPVQPWFHNWAFNRLGSDICKHWDLIPLDTQILMTHGPIEGYLDLTLEGATTGCPYLRSKVAELKDLKVHICGHIHEAYGVMDTDAGVKLINASVLDRNYIMKNKPVIFEL